MAENSSALRIVGPTRLSGEVTVTGAKKEEKVKIPAGGTAQFDCAKGCKAHLGKKDKGAADLVLKGTEKAIVIAKDGKLSAN